MNRRVYIAGPIGNGHTAKPREFYKNVRFAEKFYYTLIKYGWTPFCPHLSYHAWLAFPEDVPWPRWVELDLDYIDTCAALLRIPGASIGADMEVAYANEKKIPVIHAANLVEAVTLLENTLGEPKPRPELKTYLEMIKPATN